MSELYFYLHKGRAIGPFGKSDIVEAIRFGKISAFDLIFKDGSEKWLPLHSVKEFKEYLHENEAPNLDDFWITLTKKMISDKSIVYVQNGPFSTAQIKQKLSQGDLAYSDFVWREGQNKWQRLSGLEVFNPAPIKWTPAVKLPHDVETPPETFKADEVLAEILARRAAVPKLDIKPEFVPEEPVTAVTNVAKRMPRSPAMAGVKEKTNINKKAAPFVLKPRRSLSQVWYAAGIFLIFVVVIAVTHQDELAKLFGVRVRKEVVVPKKAPPKPAPVVAAPELAKPAMAKETAKEVSKPVPVVKEPTYVRLRQSGSVVTLETDGSEHFYPAKITVSGEAGEILDYVSFYKEFKLSRPESGLAQIKLEDLSLGDGPYLLEAQMQKSEQIAQLRIKWMNQPNGFAVALQRHRKLIALPFFREKKKILRAVNQLNELAGQINKAQSNPKTWPTAYSRWRKDMQDWSQRHFKNINLSAPANLVFPAQWKKMRDLRDSLRQEAQAYAQDIKNPGATNTSHLTFEVDRTARFHEALQRIALYR